MGLRGGGLLTRLKTLLENRSVVVPAWKTYFGEESDIKFSDYVNAYLTDATVKAVVDNLTAQVVSTGFYVQTEPPELKDFVEEWNERSNVWLWLQNTCRELLYAGNSFTLKPSNWADVNLANQILPLSSIKKARRSEEGEILEYEAEVNGKTVKYAAEDVIHSAWNVIDRKAFGVGLLAPLLLSREDASGDVVPPLLKIKAQIENDLRRVLHKYPPRFLIYLDTSDENIRNIKSVFESLKAGEDLVTNVKCDLKELSVSSRAQFDYIADLILNQIYLCFGTPLPKLLTTPGFTEASARAAIEVSEAFREMLRSYLKRQYETQIAKPMLAEQGFTDASVKFAFGTPDIPTLSFQDLCRIFELGGMRLDEFRKNIQKFGVELWDEGKGGS